MNKFCLIGNPVKHSRSRKLFSAAYPGKQFSYDLLEYDNIEKAMASFNLAGYSGANITSPFKEQIMNHIKYPDRLSSIIGAANTIIKNKDGLHSYNTDYYGVSEIVKNLLSQDYDIAAKPCHKQISNAMIIGAGGAGKAAALAIKDLGINVVIANRTPEKVIRFAEKTNINVIGLNKIKQYAEDAQLIIYALSIPLACLTKEMLAGKIMIEANYVSPNYAPEKPEYPNNIKENTEIRSDTSKKKSQEDIFYINGKEWLFYQAVKAFELFTGIKPNTVSMREVL